VPLVLFFSHGGWPTAIAAFVMLCFHFGIPVVDSDGRAVGVNVFMMFSVLALFVGHASVGLSDLTTPLPVLLSVSVAGNGRAGKPVPAQGVFPARHALLRGNWDTTLWCIKPSADEKIANGVVAIASMPAAQLRSSTAVRSAQIPMYMG